MAEERKSRSWHFVVIGLVAVAVAAFVVLRGRPVGNGIGPVDTVATDPLKAVSLLNEGLGLLENGQADVAADKFQELKTLAPAELAVARNLAIATVLAIAPETLDKVRSPEKFQSGLARAEEAVTKLRALEPKLPTGALLAARLAEHRDDRTKQLEFLQEAATLADGDPVFEAEVFLASRASDSPDAQAKGLAALKRAGEDATDNLWLLTELVVAQATSQDADIVKTITRLRDASGPFVEFVKKLRNVDLLDLLDKAKAATESGDWNTVTRNARLVSNLLRPEIATKLDQRRLVKHPLEYVASDFSAEWHVKHDAQLAKGTDPSAPPIEVTFAEAAPSDQLPALAGIRDAKIADFDLDGRWDVVVLLSGQVIVFGQPDQESGSRKAESGAEKANSRWVTLCEAVVPSGMTKLLVSDLDRDTEETPDEHRFIGQVTASSASKEKTPDGAAERVEDADPDVLVYGADGVQFLRNQYDKGTKSRSLQQIAQDAAFDALRDVLAVAPADIDHDGDLDLVVSSNSGMSVWQNNDSREHTKFADISSRSALPPKELKATVLLPVDWNFDVQTDVLVTGLDVVKPGWLENISHGRLRWLERPTSEQRIALAGSLFLDSLRTDRLEWNLVAGENLRIWDFDNDGQRDQLKWTVRFIDRDKRLTDLSTNIGSKERKIFYSFEGEMVGCEIADFDADGDEDVLAVTDQRPIWVRNDGGNKNGWIDISIRADKDRKPQRDSERVNAHGVGSVIELRAAGLANMPGRKSHVRVVEGQSTHFGLGPVKQVDAVRIIWTNGIPQNVIRPRAGEAIAAQQILKGSCPYLYTWDGEQWAFFTDCLWAAPIGLQLAEGVLAPSREWEYLKIDGERLRETNGEYRVMLTEELWEAAYLDQVRLLAVDHPADVEFFSNEKVGPPSISEFKLHPVRKRRTPVAARDHRGRDVLSKLAQRDEQYLRAFDKIIQQGLTEEHFIELDLGDIRDAKNVTLFLTGWIFPTDTSINVSLSQNPDRDGPKPPSIWVPAGEEGEIGREGDGEAGRRRETKWREAIPYIGFPGGKTKTIAVDVTEALGLNESGKGKAESGKDADNSPLATRHSPLKLRIVTSMELYWDEMFFTVDEPPLEQTTTELPLVAADLQFRGFSARLPHPEFGPERYDAAKVSTDPQWPPMGGRFTRYGDVTELLTEADDRMAVFGAGDAVTIRFRADQTPKLPPGWKRDFIIHNVGYDKDADLNTIYGQFVEPLPFRAMRGYPDPTGAEYPDSPTHRDYLNRFQTREQNRRAFWLSR